MYLRACAVVVKVILGTIGGAWVNVYTWRGVQGRVSPCPTTRDPVTVRVPTPMDAELQIK